MSSDERNAAPPPPSAGRHGFDRPGAIRTLWIVFIAVLAVTVAAEVLVHLHPRFRLEGRFAFHAVWGFVSCVAMVLFANLLGFFLKRREDYYTRRKEWPDSGENGVD